RGKTTVFVVPPPTVVDADGTMGPTGRFELKEDGDRSWIVSTVLPQEWLDESDRSWPVTVDPTVTTLDSSATDDCTVQLLRWDTGKVTGPGQVCNTFDNRPIGTYSGSNYLDDRTELLRFDALTLVQSDAIDSAQLQLYRESSVLSRPIDVF